MHLHGLWYMYPARFATLRLRSLNATGSSSLQHACSATAAPPLLVVENCTLGLPDEGEREVMRPLLLIQMTVSS
jgi:hypothetical protein